LIFKITRAPAYRQAGSCRELEIINSFQLFSKGWVPSQNDLKIVDKANKTKYQD
jgi:hypothetical protein